MVNQLAQGALRLPEAHYGRPSPPAQPKTPRPPATLARPAPPLRLAGTSPSRSQPRLNHVQPVMPINPHFCPGAVHRENAPQGPPVGAHPLGRELARQPLAFGSHPAEMIFVIDRRPRPPWVRRVENAKLSRPCVIGTQHKTLQTAVIHRPAGARPVRIHKNSPRLRHRAAPARPVGRVRSREILPRPWLAE